MKEPPPVVYDREAALPVAEFRQVLVESGLGARRPVDDEPRLREMLSGANLILTARQDDPDRRLIGVARCITDFTWSCYLSELAVSASAQGRGVGRGLLDEARRRLGPRISLILMSVPDAVGFYERAGMARVEHTFWYRRKS